MTAAAAIEARPSIARGLPGWAGAVLLLAVVAGAGPVAGGLVRPLFVAGCAALGWYSWRRSPADHLQTAIVLFCFAPFARRMVDAAIGFDDLGLMLVGPLVALLGCVGSLSAYLERSTRIPGRLYPVLGVALCVGYATALSFAEADWKNAATGALKWGAPLVYAAALGLRLADPDRLLVAAAKTFAFALPIMGLYGLFQYVDPPGWDRYWMEQATILSIGQPVPFGVRTFATMNAPASFATFTAAGLLLVFFLRGGWLTLLGAVPAGVALLLSSYRTAWISLCAGLLFCTLFSATRRRSLAAVGALGIALGAAVITPVVGEALTDRLTSFAAGAQDGSAQERLQEFALLWTTPDSGLVGQGFTVTDVGSAGAQAIDGMPIALWVTMGLVVGLCCLCAFLWAAGQPIVTAFRLPTPSAIVVGALAVGAICQMPLASVASGELGFLFWTTVALAPSLNQPHRIGHGTG